MLVDGQAIADGGDERGRSGAAESDLGLGLFAAELEKDLDNGQLEPIGDGYKKVVT